MSLSLTPPLFIPRATPGAGRQAHAQETRALLQRHPLLEGVPLPAFDALLRAALRRNYDPGEVIAHQAEPAENYALLLAGSARAFVNTADGSEVTLQLLGAPCAWGEGQLWFESRQPMSLIAVDRSVVLWLPRRDFSELLARHPELQLNVLRDTAERLAFARERERALVLSGVTERLADLLMSYQRLYGIPVNGGTLIRIVVSQADLARDLGVALKSVSRAFQHLLRDGVVEKFGSRLLVRKVDVLSAMSPWFGIDWVSGRYRTDESFVSPLPRPTVRAVESQVP
ncbi:MAG: Crp/Fnr family transcriptional regulator [Archangiaceae bacterium]|nr:Crp/Fnr family transcriptional regulator [Archangiaceae bacterium]